MDNTESQAKKVILLSAQIDCEIRSAERKSRASGIETPDHSSWLPERLNELEQSILGFDSLWEAQLFCERQTLGKCKPREMRLFYERMAQSFWEP